MANRQRNERQQSSSSATPWQGLLNAGSFDSWMGLLGQHFPQYAGMMNQQAAGGTPPGYPTPPPGDWQWGQSADQIRGMIGQMPMTVPPLSTASSQFRSNYGNLTKDLYSGTSSSKKKKGD